MSEPLRDRLLGRLPGATRAEGAIASFMLSNLGGLPFETSATIAARTGVSEATVGRFCRAIGYASFKDLKTCLREELGDQPWLIGDRLRDLQVRARDGADLLAPGLEREIAALVAVYEIAATPDWARAADRLARVGTVYAAGFQTERGMAQIFVNQLQYLRDGVRLLDLSAGNFAELLAAEAPDEAALVLFEARRYSRQARMLAEDARTAGIRVTLVTDPWCDWGHEVADEMFVVPTDAGLFWESTAQMASLANLLVAAVFTRLGPDVEARMNRIAALYDRYTGHLAGPGSRLRGPRRLPAVQEPQEQDGAPAEARREAQPGRHAR